jgi:molybdate transport system substrate-binding protein
VRPALLLALLLLTGCGGASSADPTSRLIVSAASSLTGALTACSPTARLQFAGSDELAAQIEQGIEPDVYAAANTKLPETLHEKGLLAAPVKFATNELVVAVPRESKIGSMDDLNAPGLKLAIGSESVPIGSYTRATLAKLPSAQSKAILANVRSNEPDVKGIVGKLTQGAVDAGFIYATDVNAARGRLKAVELPAALKPQVTYEAGVVRGAKHPQRGRVYVDGLLHGACAGALRTAGFGPAP